jgi:rhodanese-related sulfurtransferase
MTPMPSDWPRITPSEAARSMNETDGTYLDVRTVAEFEAGHPEGAFNVPWQLENPGEPNPRFVAVASASFDKAQTLIIGCQTGRRSTLAAAALTEAGFNHVLEQFAGYAGRKDAFGKMIQAGWERAGLPITTQAAPGHSYRELCEAKPGSGR